IFVVPIAVAGLLTFPKGSVDQDMYLLGLPILAGNQTFTLIAFVGGLSAATAMVVVETVALSIMVCNDLLMPFILRRRTTRIADRKDMGRLLLHCRRAAIVAN